MIGVSLKKEVCVQLGHKIKLMIKQKHKYHYTLKTICVVTNDYYIGKRSTNKKPVDDDYLGSGNLVKASIKKYGKKNHIKEIIEIFSTSELAFEGEKKLITRAHLDNPKCMNLMPGGKGGFISDKQQYDRSTAGGQAFAKSLKDNPKIFKAHSKRTTKVNNEMVANPNINFPNNTTGFKWCNNGVIRKLIPPPHILPDGFSFGTKLN